MDDVSSERFLSGGRRATDGQHSAPPAAAARHSLQRTTTRPARWQPQNWQLRTRLLALAGVPLVLALALGALRIFDARRHTALRDFLIIGAVVLMAVVVLVMLTRSILEPLQALRESASDLADRRLPAVIERLRAGNVRVEDTKINPLPVETQEDVGQIARAFDAVHGEVVRLAAEQAALRANVNDMFVNLSRRSQSLVERQLALIDELERSEQDPDRLAALFRLDHLATRMRRNGENLLVLAGAELRQRSGEPVPIVDVLRAAVSEIENYQRVAVRPLPWATVSGLVVNDIVHLVAELLDNATAYSNPESPVTLSARFSDDGGLAIEISDLGTGIPRTRLTAINERLAAPQAVDVSVSRQMGLFVVGRLANRQGLRVYLSPQENPGVTATVVLPSRLISAEPAAPAERQDTDSLARLYAQPAPRSNPVAAPEQPTQLITPQEPAALPEQPTNQHIPPAEPPTAPEQPGLLGDPVTVNGTTLDTPIFEAVLSRWFTAPDEPAPRDNGWESDADAGWQAARAASEPTANEMTAAGLPKRRPQAFLVPGSVGSDVTADERPAAPVARSADAVRGRMSSYQQGLTRGRHARPATIPDELPTGNGFGRHSRAARPADETARETHDDRNAEGTR